MSLRQAQTLLEPYVKKRQDASKIRQVLSSHLNSHLSATNGQTVHRPLSLIETTCVVETTHGIRGLQKEYLRCARANVKARNEYAAVSKEHHAAISQDEMTSVSNQSTISLSTASFLDLTRQQQKHERLCIIQDYIDSLSQKPAASAEHLDPELALRDVDSLPKVPAEVLNPASAASNTPGLDLKALVDQLEKSVLRAKLLLKKEQKLLAKLRSENRTSTANRDDRLQALGLTRNELINWIEAEMEKAGDGPENIDEGAQSHSDNRGKDYIDGQLAAIQRQYARYIDAREALIISTSTTTNPTTTAVDEVSDSQDTSDELPKSESMQIIYPYLERMVDVANQQKAAIQQRSHLTISLAKQVKEASQGLDRLADESHLLPAYPMPTSNSQRKGPLSFNDELAQHEKPDSSNRATAWVFSAESSSHALKDAVSEQLETGGTALEDLQGSLSKLQSLLGYEQSPSGGVELQKQDIWERLDGSLGMINNVEAK